MKGLSVLTAVVLVVAVVLIVHGGGVSAVGVFPVGFCDPKCAGIANGNKVVDPYNCTQFYYCSNGDPYGPVACGDHGGNFFFDSVLGECGPYECSSICGPGANCPLTCNGSYDSVADAFNCSIYYICTPGGGYQYICPEEFPHYDGHTFSCVNDESVCCGGYCEAYCSGSGVSFVPDPMDCTKFYICDNVEGPPDEEHHFTCNDGYFDVQVGYCVSGTPPDPCPTLCDAARR